ncbi:ankyrin repeat domain-containing protein [Candidatus Uabimicrobium amorphum]|uniref:UNC-44 ankyrin n=1 Tax=Uabimicrobium amorphum TaxID=2596890 RepID=A0A5S9IIT3_UABAM|nr:ankyrin repeat domain-containing protein [Candidatus Uabimicrobium amorphum]BBM82311.1 UNC-44 ankyrin [Candidatus Uabimicrobium amorphum]
MDVQKLIDAIAQESIEQINNLLKQNIDVNQLNDYEELPLICAVETENSKIVKILIEAGADVNKYLDRSPHHIIDPLSHAIETHNSNIVQLLVNAGADVKRYDYLEQACNENATGVVKTILRAGATVTTEALMAALQTNRKLFDTVLEQYGSVDAKLAGKLLIEAAEYSSWDIIPTLLQKGADVNTRNEYGETALHIALKNEYVSPVKMLLDAGADVTAVDDYDLTPIKMGSDIPEVCDLIRLFSKKNVAEELKQCEQEQQQSEKESQQIYATRQYQQLVNTYKPQTPQQNTNTNNAHNNMYQQMFGMLHNQAKDPIQNFFQTFSDPKKCQEFSDNLSKNMANQYKDTIESLGDGKPKQRLQEKAPHLEQIFSRAMGSIFNEKEDEKAITDMNNVMMDMFSSTFSSLGDKILNSAKDLDFLTKTIICNDVNNLELLLEKYDVNAVNTDGITPLMLSCYFGYENMTKILLDCGANPNVAGKECFAGETPLTMAVEQHSNSMIIAMLMEKGANVHHQNLQGNTVLMKAISMRWHDPIILGLIVQLIDLGADIKLQNNNKKTVQQITADILQKNIRRSDINTSILILQEIQKILSDPQSLNNLRLVCAAYKGHIEKVKTLLEKGAMVNYISCIGTALSNAVMTQQQGIISYLIDHGANVNLADQKKTTSLIEAATTGNFAIVKLLIDAGAVVNCRDEEGVTPLLEAAAGGYPDIVQLLIDHDANLHDQIFDDRYCRTRNALNLAQENAQYSNETRFQETVQLLESAGLNAL